MGKRGIIIGIIAVCLGFFYLGFVHYTEPTEVGVKWNLVSGEISADERSGFHFTPPWVLVANIDTRPVRVCVTSASRSVNCKLVQFDKNYCRQLVEAEGFRYYWWDNRISFNLGYSDEYRGQKDLMRGYAYSVKDFPFIKTITVYDDGDPYEEP